MGHGRKTGESGVGGSEKAEVKEGVWQRTGLGPWLVRGEPHGGGLCSDECGVEGGM